MKVSIIVPVYNVEKFLRACIDSLISQTYKDVEIILVDDGSTDSSGIICDQYHQTDDRVIVLHDSNGGLSEARKRGILKATGDYLMIVDGDDWIDANTIETCLEIANKHRDADCIIFSYIREYPGKSIESHVMSCSAVLEGEDVKYRVYRRLYGLVGEELRHPERLENMGSCCMKLYKKDVASKGRFFDVKEVGSSEDVLFNMYALSDSNKVVYIDKPMYHYRKAGVSITSSYRPKLIEQWKRLFTVMRSIVHEKGLDGSYSLALDSRIALSIFGIGMNEITGMNNSKSNARNRIRSYINESIYRDAVKNIDLRFLPVPWKCLIWFAKNRVSSLVYLELLAISKVRKSL